jgi:hypothetical protein
VPRPVGITRPNARAIARGLSFAMDFGDPSLRPWIRRTTSGGAEAAVTAALAGGATRSWMPRAGYGITGNGGYWGSSGAGNTYALPTTEGTVIVAVVADHNANDGVAHQPFFLGVNSSNRTVEAVKWSDNNLYIGIIDKRMVFSVSGLYLAGDPAFTIATTWQAAGQAAFVKGVQRGTSASTGLGDTSGGNFVLGQNDAATRKWSSGTTGGVLFALIFDRALTVAEIAEADRDLWWWARQSWDPSDLTDTLDEASLAAALASTLPPITGDLSATFPAPSFTAAGALAIASAVNATFPAPSFTAAGQLAIAGSLSATFPAPSFTAAGQLAIAGSLSATFPAPSFTAAGVLTDPFLPPAWLSQTARTTRSLSPRAGAALRPAAGSPRLTPGAGSTLRGPGDPS